ncbi:MAG: glycosyltransferase [Planctomycetaceae bacterium]
MNTLYCPSYTDDRVDSRHHVLTVLIPSYNEEATLEKCVERVRQIATDNLELEIIIIDDCSTNRGREIACDLAERFDNVRVLLHDVNRGKGAALHTGIKAATGDFIAIQDADLEYDPRDLVRLIQPLIHDQAEVSIGSRFLSDGMHRVLYFWHSMGNKFLTFLSNMFTDLNLSDMETCYKVFRRELLQSIELKEKRFGFEPEVVAAVAQRRVRIVEMGISYMGRTYEEGKKIGVRDGFRALYCIVRYNAHNLPAPLQFMLYVFVGGTCAVVNLLLFLALLGLNVSAVVATPIAFLAAAALNYWMCISLIFRHQSRWGRWSEIAAYSLSVLIVGMVDWMMTVALLATMAPAAAKSIATLVGLVLNFAVRRIIVFPERSPGPWIPQGTSISENVDEYDLIGAGKH